MLFFTKKRKLQNSTMISEIGSLLVMVFVVAILLLYIDYNRIIMTRIELDNLNKTMLLTAEMYGGLSEADMDAFYNNLESMGISKTSIMNSNFPTIKDKGQFTYGTPIIISYTVNINSPVYKRFNGTIFSGGIHIAPIIPINIYGETVSKW